MFYETLDRIKEHFNCQTVTAIHKRHISLAPYSKESLINLAYIDKLLFPVCEGESE